MDSEIQIFAEFVHFFMYKNNCKQFLLWKKWYKHCLPFFWVYSLLFVYYFEHRFVCTFVYTLVIYLFTICLHPLFVCVPFVCSLLVFRSFKLYFELRWWVRHEPLRLTHHRSIISRYHSSRSIISHLVPSSVIIMVCIYIVLWCIIFICDVFYIVCDVFYLFVMYFILFVMYFICFWSIL